MIGTIAIALAAIMIPTAQTNSLLPEAYSDNSAPTAYVQQAGVQTGKIYTPHGTEVDVYYPQNEITEDVLDLCTYFFTGGGNYTGYYYNNSGETVTLKNDCIRVGDPTTIFNAKAFAFYMYWHEKWDNGLGYESIACSIDDISRFIEDHSFIELDLTTDEPQVNDVVCYKSGNNIVSAGIIKQVFASEASNPLSNQTFVKRLSKYRIQSMWSFFGLYEHRGDLTPYISKYSVKDSKELVASDSVIYYRRHEKHKYIYKYTKKDGNFHYSYCECGEKIAERHSLLRGSNRSMYCQYCYYVVPSSPIIKPTIPITADFDYNDIDYKKLFKD